MKKLVLSLAAITGAIALSACQGTNNSPAPAAPAAATTCTLNQFGQSVNSAGQPCVSSTTACGVSGVPVNGTACGTGSYGYGGYGYGYGGMGYGGGCYYWDTLYPGSNYVPAYDPTGNLVCLNTSTYGISVPSTYTYSQPVYVSTCPYGDPYSCSNYFSGSPSYYGGGYGYGGGGSGVCVGGGTDSFMIGACF